MDISQIPMSSVQLLNPNADVARRNLALQVNLNAALSLQAIMKTNLGPQGTLKMYSVMVAYFGSNHLGWFLVLAI